MNKKLDKIKHFRHFILNQVSVLTGEQLNLIPVGYSNNIIWNLGHLLATVQAICYKRAGLPITIDDKFFSPFLPTTKPDKYVSKDEIETIKGLLVSSIDILKTDYDNNIFCNYTRSVNIAKVYGIEVANIEDALEFLLYHEGLHSGYIGGLIHVV